MLTAAIVSGDQASAAQLLASLQQTGLVSPAIRKWIIPEDKAPEPGENIADIVLLDLSRDPEPFFAFGSLLRRMHPALRLIACSATNPPSPQVLLDAMRSGVQDFVTRPVAPEALRDILARLNQDGMAAAVASQRLIVVM